MIQLTSTPAASIPLRLPKPSRLRAVTIAGRADPEPQPAMIELEGVSKTFRSGGRATMAAVENLTLSIAERSLTLVTGPSGSGKTTLLAVIGCMMRPSAGRVTVAGEDVTRLSEDLLSEVRRRSFGFVFQSNYLIRRATALENVMVPGLPCPEFNGDLRHRACSLLARLGLDSKIDQRIETLSGGEQQRVTIARALINEPEVVIADEPTAHLDSSSAHSFIDLAFEMVGRGKSVIVASHDPAICGVGSYNQVFELRDGHLA